MYLLLLFHHRRISHHDRMTPICYGLSQWYETFKPLFTTYSNLQLHVMVPSMPINNPPFSIALKLMTIWMITATIQSTQTERSGFANDQIQDRRETLVTGMMEDDSAGHHSVFTANDKAMLHTDVKRSAPSVGNATPLLDVTGIETTYNVITVARLVISNVPVLQSDLASLELAGLNGVHVTLYPHPVQDLQKRGVDEVDERKETGMTRKNVADLDLPPPALNTNRLLQLLVVPTHVLSPKRWYMPSNNPCLPSRAR